MEKLECGREYGDWAREVREVDRVVGVRMDWRVD